MNTVWLCGLGDNSGLPSPDGVSLQAEVVETYFVKKLFEYGYMLNGEWEECNAPVSKQGKRASVKRTLGSNIYYSYAYVWEMELK